MYISFCRVYSVLYIALTTLLFVLGVLYAMLQARQEKKKWGQIKTKKTGFQIRLEKALNAAEAEH
jgi:hypothetical protein